MLLNLVQLSNAPAPTLPNEPEMPLTVVRLEQPLNASLPMDVTLELKLVLGKFVQPWNALLPMVTLPDPGKVRLEREVLYANALVPIDTETEGMATEPVRPL